MHKQIFLGGLFALLFACEEDKQTEPNVAPEFTLVEITPSTEVTTSTSLVCLATATDVNEDPLQLTVLWTDSAGTELGVDSVLPLNPELVSPEEVVTCTATITDGLSDPVVQSVSVTVENTAPVIDVIAITPDAGVGADSGLECAAQASDADLDDVTPIERVGSWV